jgi:O-antigen/teichoic acid export membrane protein
MSDYRPRFSVVRIAEVFRFSRWVILQNLFHGLREQTPVFVISRLIDVHVLGLFNLAREIAAFVTSELRAPIRRALYPGFARMSLENGELKAGFIDSFALLFLLSLPMSVGLYVVAPMVVEVVLGPRWGAAVPLLEVLAVHGIVQSLGANTNLVLNRVGRPDLSAMVGFGHIVVFVPAVVWGAARYGAIGAAWAIVACSLLLIVAEYALMRRFLGVRLSQVAARAWRPAFAAACMGASVALLRDFWPTPEGGVASLSLLLVLVVAGVVIYTAVLALAWLACGAGPGAERHVFEAAARVFRPRRRAGAAP